MKIEYTSNVNVTSLSLSLSVFFLGTITCFSPSKIVWISAEFPPQTIYLSITHILFLPKFFFRSPAPFHFFRPILAIDSKFVISERSRVPAEFTAITSAFVPFRYRI